MYDLQALSVTVSLYVTEFLYYESRGFLSAAVTPNEAERTIFVVQNPKNLDCVLRLGTVLCVFTTGKGLTCDGPVIGKPCGFIVRCSWVLDNCHDKSTPSSSAALATNPMM